MEWNSSSSSTLTIQMRYDLRRNRKIDFFWALNETKYLLTLLLPMNIIVNNFLKSSNIHLCAKVSVSLSFFFPPEKILSGKAFNFTFFEVFEVKLKNFTWPMEKWKILQQQWNYMERAHVHTFLISSHRLSMCLLVCILQMFVCCFCLLFSQLFG